MKTKSGKSKLRVIRATIKNILGIEELDFSLGNVTILSGANGSGKTSALEAFRSIFVGGHDATLLHNGADKGEVVLVLNDKSKLVKTVKESASKLSVRDPNGGDVTAPKSFVDALHDTFACNPIDFLTAPKSSRVKTLLEMTPFTLDAAQIKPLTALCTAHHVLPTKEPLAYLDSVRKDLFDKRTGVNRSLKDKRATAIEIEQGLPPADDTLETIDARILEIKDVIFELSTSCTQDTEKLRKSIADRKSLAANDCATVKLNAQKAIREIEAAMAATCRTLESACTDKVTAIQNEITALQSDTEYTLTPEREEMARLNQQRDEVQRASGSRQLAIKMQAEAFEHEAEAEVLTSALETIDNMKLKLMEQLPIDGVEIKNGDIYLDGVPFDRVNEARKIQAAIQLAVVRSQKLDLPFVCVDGLERLDESTFALFVEQAAETDVQFIVSRVSEDKELTISTQN